jgi:NADPH-dependent 2,4-dienoyl-CoA reductase/sulfur reductase-like enzyme
MSDGRVIGANSLPAEALRPDVLIIGFGPAGMAAAVRASECGARVLVIDDNAEPGGQIWRGGKEAHKDALSRRWFAQVSERSLPILQYSQIVSASASSRSVLVETSSSNLEISFQKLIVATGAREIFLPFPGWTLPGIMGAGGLQALVKSGLPITGKKVVVAGSGPLLLAVAANLKKAGGRVRMIAEQALQRDVTRFALNLLHFPSKILQAAALQLLLVGIPYRYNCWVEAAEGDGHLERLRIRQGDKVWTESCDYAAIGYGLYPNVEISSLLGCAVEATGVTVDKWQCTSLEHIYCAGECTGIGGVDLSLVEGEIAGYSAAGHYGLAERLFARRAKAIHFARKLNETFVLRKVLRSLAKSETLVCRCEDVNRGRLEKLSSFRAAKLHTRCGMGPCQGRVCGPATEFLFGWQKDTTRPPIFPTSVGGLTTDEAVPEEALQNSL